MKLDQLLERLTSPLSRPRRAIATLFATFKPTPGAPGPALAALVVPVRTKGMLVFAALIVYSVLIAWFAFHQKNLLLRDFEAIQGTLETEAMLKQADIATFHAVTALFVNLEATDPAKMERIGLHYQSLLERHGALQARLPGADLNMAQLRATWAELNANPSRARLNRMIAQLVHTRNDIAALAEQLQSARQRSSERYRRQADSAALTALVCGMLGLSLLGAVSVLFFRRLTDDLRILQQRALDIVKGYRGPPLRVTRHDEVGQLMEAVNNMAQTLDQREKEVTLKRQKYFHQEKMAAIGALAAGVAHEIGNPIAAICGIAQEMIDRRACSGINPECHDCRPDLIYAQTERLAAITREIAEFASPHPAEPQFLDLNAQLRSTSRLIRYDKRSQHVSLRLDLDSQLPAIYGVGDQLTQLVMNLLINSMDALENVQGRTPTITITTKSDPEHERASLLVADNGEGIAPDLLGRVFEAFFTTKPAGKGTGLGLSLCYSIVKKHGGTIDIDSTLDQGTRVQVYFPLNDTAYNEAEPA